MSKISGYANSVSALGTDDLIDVSEKISSSPDVYESRKMTGAILAAFIQTYAKNILENNGLTMTGNQTHDLNNLVLTFQNAGFAIEGAQTITSASAIADIFNIYDETSTLLHRFNNAFISLFGGGVPSGSEKLLINDKTKITDRLELSGTTDGFLMPRLTTAQMNAIASPTTNLLIYNTDLSGLYRYNGAAWVALSAGYGIIEIIRDSDAGIPTFYADLQTALETCKTSGSNNVVKLHSDITITSAISIKYNGSGVGFAYRYESLTIDFNGFKVINDEADTSYAFDVSMGNISSANQHISFVNGQVIRTSGTGTHYALNMNYANTYGSVTMSNMVWYCENSYSASLRSLQNNQPNSSSFDLGGSLFYSKNSESMVITSTLVKNFINKTESSTSSHKGLYINGGNASDFISLAENGAIALQTKSNVYITNFRVKSTTGRALYVGSDSEGSINNFYAESTTGDAVYIHITDSRYNKILSNFEARATTGNALANSGWGQISNAILINDGSAETCDISGTFDMYNCTIINKGSGDCVNNSQGDFRAFNCVLRSVGGSCATIVSSNASTTISYRNCDFLSLYDNASGHCINITDDTGGIEFANCTFEVYNSSANCVYAAAARTASIGNCGFKGATTAINANVTVALTAAPDANGNYTI